MSGLATIKQHITPPALLYGSGIAVALYTCLFVLLSLNAGKTISALEEKLASETVEIEQKIVKVPDIVFEDIPRDDKDSAAHVTDAPAVPSVPKGDALAPAPAEGLYEEGQQGVLPVKAANNLRPFDVYKKPFAATGKPLIAVTVLDYGLNPQLSESALSALPSEVSLILSPYAQNPDSHRKKARSHGHEIWLSLPTQTNSYPYKDPGAHAILSDGGLAYNQNNLHWTLSRTAGYAGVAAFMDSSFAGSATTTKNVFGEIFDRGLGYIELNPNAEATVETIALLQGAPYIRNGFQIENTSLKALEKVAQEKGYVVAVLTPSPNGLQSLHTWLNTLETKGFTLAPLSAIAKLNEQ